MLGFAAVFAPLGGSTLILQSRSILLEQHPQSCCSTGAVCSLHSITSAASTQTLSKHTQREGSG